MSARLATPADDALLSSIVMHPDVRAWNAHDGAPDFVARDYTTHPKSFAVIVEGGCFLLPALEQGAYAVHTNLLPGARGCQAVLSAVDAMTFAFVHTDAQQLVTMVPANNRHALWFAHTMGFRDTFRRKDMWLWHGALHDMQFLRMDIDDWVLRSQEMREFGHAFHAERIEQGSPANHGEDDVHDAYVGATWALIAAGQLDKAQQLYGRWARAAGYQAFEILSRTPLRIDIGDGVLRVADGTFTVET